MKPFFVRGITAIRAKGPSVQIARAIGAIGPGGMATTIKRPERPAVRSDHERSTLWASGKHVGLQTWADGLGYVNGWAFGPESHDKTLGKMLHSVAFAVKRNQLRESRNEETTTSARTRALDFGQSLIFNLPRTG